MITHDGGMLRRCGTESACKKIHGAASDYGHRPVGTLSDYLGVGTGVLAAYVVTANHTGESYARICWWQPPMIVARPFAGGAGI